MGRRGRLLNLECTSYLTTINTRAITRLQLSDVKITEKQSEMQAKKVDLRGFEPRTPRMRSECDTPTPQALNCQFFQHVCSGQNNRHVITLRKIAALQKTCIT